IFTPPVAATFPVFVTVTAASPGAVPGGIRQLICAGATKKSGASRSTPALSRTLTAAPAISVGNGKVVAAWLAVARPAPNAATMDSLATPSPLKLAAEAVVTAAGCITGAVRHATVSAPGGRRGPRRRGVGAAGKRAAPGPGPIAPRRDHVPCVIAHRRPGAPGR